MNRWTHKRTDSYHLEFEINPEGLLFVHIHIYKWSPSVYKELLSVWSTAEEMIKDSGVDVVYGFLPEKNEMFASMFGFNLHGIYNSHTLVSKEI